MNGVTHLKGSHPFKGESRDKTPLHEKDPSFFLLTLLTPHDNLVSAPGFTPVTSFLLVYGLSLLIRTSHPSGSRQLCFKRNKCTSSAMLKTRPLVHSDPRKSSVPYRVQLKVSQILWLLARPLWTHGIGESE